MLKEFYASHPNKKLLGKVKDVELTHLQQTVNVYQPIEAYSEKWDHIEDKETGKFVSANPIPGTRVRNDLPPLYIQWKEDWKTRRANQR